MKEFEYYLGIDGGGTKTEFMLCDRDDNVVKQFILNGCNPNDIGLDECFSILEKGCREVCDTVDYKKISVFVGIAGIGACDASEEVISFLNSLGFGNAGCDSDVGLSVALTIGDNDGVTVIMGTGIVTVVQKSKEKKILGGFNYFFDDGGSAFNLGRDAIKYALVCEERNFEKGSLYNSILKKCETTSVRQCLPDFYKYGKSYIAQFSKCVTETICTDNNSAKIFERNMICVAEMINYALTCLDGVNKVYITGGLTCCKELIEKYMFNYLKKDCEVCFVDAKPVYGALKLAGMEKIL